MNAEERQQNFYQEEQMVSVKRSALTLFLAVLFFSWRQRIRTAIRLQTQVVSEMAQFVALKCADNGRADVRRDSLHDAETRHRGQKYGKSWRRK